MPVFKEDLSEGELYLLQKCTEEYKDVVAQINELTARKAELVEKMVENGFGDHISGHLNLGDGNEIVMSFTQSVKVKQAEFKQLQYELPKEVLNDCFKPEYKLNKDAYNRLSDDVKNILSLNAKDVVKSKDGMKYLNVKVIAIPNNITTPDSCI